MADALVPRSWGQVLLGDPDLGQRWGTGFMLSSPPSRPMLGSGSFGHDGAGGQLGFADEIRRVGFAYPAPPLRRSGSARGVADYQDPVS